jgi:predicted nucleic acid-binding protein
MPLVTFDSSVIIGRRPSLPQTGFVLIAVVLQELIAGADDRSAIKAWETTWRLFEEEGRLLIPTGEDWFQAGRILNSLLRGLKSKAKGRTPKLHPDDKQRLIRDVLIARTALREGATVVTDNIRDFEAIRRFCKVKVMSGQKYFGG